jgi:hypothetical protein
MMRDTRLEHRFVQHVPKILEAAVLYISIGYGTAVHNCCCGCGEEVVTPFSPTDWHMTYDGETVSLYPSIGNWNSACRSHYFIKRNMVIEAEPWSTKQISDERRMDKAAKAAYYDPSNTVEGTPISAIDSIDSISLWSRLKRWLFRSG